VAGENSSGHAEQVFARRDRLRGRPTGRDRIGRTPPVRAEFSGAPKNRRTARARKPPHPFDHKMHLSRSHEVSDRPIRADRTVPEIHYAMAAARAKPQGHGSGRLSAPAGRDPSLASKFPRTRLSAISRLSACDGKRIVRAVFATSREIASRIHHVAYREPEPLAPVELVDGVD
jgi:hypothetical protein